jgi:hypothetical protein
LNKRNLAAVAGVAAMLGAFAAPAQADNPVAAVCNEAEASFQDGYTVPEPHPDPNPPARLLGGPGEAMAVGNGQVNKGLLNAAAHSPALAVCLQGDGGGGPTGGDDGGDGGGDDGGPT